MDQDNTIIGQSSPYEPTSRRKVYANICIVNILDRNTHVGYP